jgi:dTDP-4-dehydrorhamnose reductase
MRVLIIGGNGQVGRELAKSSWPEGVTVSAPGRQGLDLADRAALFDEVSSHDTAVVINAAAYTAVDLAETNADEAYAVNAAGPHNLALATHAANIPLIQISTDYVFSGDNANEYVESDATGPINVYGRTKLAGEEAVRRINPHHIILRTAWILSRHRANFAKTMLRLATERKQLRIVDDQFGNPTSAGDLAAAIAVIGASLLSDAPASFGTYHFVNSGGATWFSLAERIMATSAALGGPAAEVMPISTVDYPTAARRPQNSRLSTSLFERTFGLTPRRWEPAVDDIVRELAGSSLPIAGGPA